MVGSAMTQARRSAAATADISNVAGGALALLYERLLGITAIEEYKLDACAAGDAEYFDLLDDLESRARQDVDKLRAVLMTRLDQELGAGCVASRDAA